VEAVRRICLLGLGEVGTTVAQALEEQNLQLTGYDTAFAHADSKASLNLKSVTTLVPTNTAADAVVNADLVISAVTAEQAINAARSVQEFLPSQAWYWDLNSVSPKSKQQMAALFESKARFVEGAIMSPIHPDGIASRILLAGSHARGFTPLIRALGFRGCEFFSQEFGKAAASKMCRSVIIKGMESLLTESLVSARYYGVEDQVLNSLHNLMPGLDWRQHSAYMISRSLQHGVRRAEEMREAFKTVTEAGLMGAMSAACADTQAWTANFNQHVQADELVAMLDQFREQLP